MTTGIGPRCDRTDAVAVTIDADDDEEQDREDAAEPLPSMPRLALRLRPAVEPSAAAHLPVARIASVPRSVLAVVGAPAHAGAPTAVSHGRPSPHAGPPVPPAAARRVRSARSSSGRAIVGEAVADAVHGQDVARLARIGLELAAQVLDVRVDRPLVRLEGDAHGSRRAAATG